MTEATLIPKLQEIKPFSQFEAQLAELKETNSKLVFDYASRDGSKAAKSHIRSMRGVKASIEAARKEAKADALAYGRMVDAEAAALTLQVEEMIEVHDMPLREIELAEQLRVARHEDVLNSIRAEAVLPACATSTFIQSRLDALSGYPIDESLQEYQQRCADARDEAKASLESALLNALHQEAKDRELDELRAMKAEQERAEREKAEAEAAERREQERQAQIEAEAKRLADVELKRHREQEAARERNRAHRAKVHNAAAEAFSGVIDLTPEQAKELVTAIAKGQIPNVSINY